MSGDCTHARVDVVWSNAADALDAAALPYGRPILEQGGCAACGMTFERRHRIDGWGPWCEIPASDDPLGTSNEFGG